MSCVCVHHHKIALLEKGLNAFRRKTQLHKSARPDPIGTCRFHFSCTCDCPICRDLDVDVSVRRRALCSYATSLPALACVLRKCPHCHIDNAFCPTELRRGPTTVFKYKKMKHCTEIIPGKSESKKWKEASVTTSFSGSNSDEMELSLVDSIKDLFPYYVMHDYMAKRVADAYQDSIKQVSVSSGNELWCFDYIENFSCFSELELQQDHYSHAQVTIFVIFVIRRRREGEELHNQHTFSLPANLAGEAHAFFSEDRLHDAGFAQVCLGKLLQQRKDDGLLADRYFFWSDGGPAHFKMYRQLHYIATQASHFGVHIIWSFFQSCHGEGEGEGAVTPNPNPNPNPGKGMHDGVGQWIKSAVARAVMSGEGISSVEQFFQYCLKFLRHNETNHNFTESRHFNNVDFDEIAKHRLAMPSTVTGSKHILATKRDSSGWFMFATGAGEGAVYQRKCICFCEACNTSPTGVSEHCHEKLEDTVDGEWFNKPYLNKFKVSNARMGQSVKDCVAYMKRLKTGNVINDLLTNLTRSTLVPLTCVIVCDCAVV
jgi:hypothetical protein